MLMSTNSYLEFYLSLLAWIINNGLWSVLSDTGLFAAPLWRNHFARMVVGPSARRG